MTEHYPDCHLDGCADTTYGRGEVDDRIALLHRTSAELDASVRAWCDDDDSPDVPGTDDPDVDDEPDEIDSWERLMWITHPPRPEPYMDGGRLRYD